MAQIVFQGVLDLQKHVGFIHWSAKKFHVKLSFGYVKKALYVILLKDDKCRRDPRGKYACKKEPEAGTLAKRTHGLRASASPGHV